MRTGAEYREALRDGRRVWVMGEGLVEDVTLHPATRPMVEEYVAWYDRHLDPEWQDVVLTPPDARGERTPWAFALPRGSADLRAMGRSYSATIFLTAGNMTHTPGYGNLIALGILDAVRQRRVSAEQLASATRYRDGIADTGRFLTFCAGGATIGARLHADPDERAALRVVRETDAGLVLRGKVGMHTSPVYAEDVYIGSHSGIDRDGHRATFVVPVNASGVTVVCRKMVARRRVRPVGARVPDGAVAGADRLVALLAPALRLARQGRVHAGPGAGLRGCDGAQGARAHAGVPGRSRHRRADGAQLPDRCRAGPRSHRRRLVHTRPRPRRRWQHRHAEGETADGRDLADRAGLVAGRGAVGQGPVRAGGGPRARGVVRRRHLHRPAAGGVAPTRLRPRRLRARRPGVGLRVARQRRSAGVARAHAPRLHRLQRAGQRRAPRAQPGHAGDRPRACARGRDAPAPSRDSATHPLNGARRPRVVSGAACRPSGTPGRAPTSPVSSICRGALYPVLRRTRPDRSGRSPAHP